jgi:hypothetical protein
VHGVDICELWEASLAGPIVEEGIDHRVWKLIWYCNSLWLSDLEIMDMKKVPVAQE